MSSSAISPKGPPRRGLAPAKAQPPGGASSTGRNGQRADPEANPRSKDVARPLRTETRPGAAVPNTQQSQGASEDAASIATNRPQPNKKPASNFPFPREPTESSSPAPPILNSQQPPIPEPLRRRQPGLVPPIPDASHPDPSARSGPPTSDVLPTGVAGQGQKPGSPPRQPGPAPPGPVPARTRAKSPLRKNPINNLSRDQERPPPLRAEQLPQAPQHIGEATGMFPQNPAPSSTNESRAQPKQLRVGAFPNTQPQIARKPVNPSSPKPQAQMGEPPGSLPPGTNPLRLAPANLPLQPGNSTYTNPLRPSPPNPPPQPGPNPSIYRPSAPNSPPRGQGQANQAPFRQGPPRGNGPLGVGGPPRPGQTYPGSGHVPSKSVDSDRSMASTGTATSTTPLNPVRRQNTALPETARQNSDLSKETAVPDGSEYYNSGGEPGDAQTPYMKMLLSLDKIPRMHNILVSVFVWILLAGFVIMPGSFTSPKRKQENESVRIPIGGAEAQKLALTPGNTAAMVVAFVCIVAGTFGSAWLALRWRRNYVWLLNKLYLPLILNALAGALATVVSVYTQQVGEWSTQAIITIVIEASILGVSIILFILYNYLLLRCVRTDQEGKKMSKKEKKKAKKAKKEKEKKEKKKKKKKGRFLAWLRRARKKPSMAPGSVV